MKIILKMSAFFLIFLSWSAYAKEEFNISTQCKDEYEMNCDVYSSLGDKQNKIIENIKSPVVKKVNSNIFSVKTSCGSPCQIYWFFSAVNEDSTDEFIAIDANRNCLIESDSTKRLIYARSLFSKNKKIIVNLRDREFNQLTSRFDYYNYFKKDTYFDNNGVLTLISRDYSNKLIQKKIKNPCGMSK